MAILLIIKAGGLFKVIAKLLYQIKTGRYKAHKEGRKRFSSYPEEAYKRYKWFWWRDSLGWPLGFFPSLSSARHDGQRTSSCWLQDLPWDTRQRAILLSEGLYALGVQRLRRDPGICLLDERFLGQTVLSGNVNTTHTFSHMLSSIAFAGWQAFATTVQVLDLFAS